MIACRINENLVRVSRPLTDDRRRSVMKKNLKIALSRETLRHLDSRGLERAAGVSVNNSVCSACVCTATYVCSNCRPCA